MNRLPNPFRDDTGQQPKPQNKVDSPGFLLLSPPTGNNSFTTLNGQGNNSSRNNFFTPGGDYIPYGNNKNDFGRRGNHRGGRGGNNRSPMHNTPGGFNGGNGNNSSPRHQTPGGFNGGGRGGSPRHQTPGGFNGGGRGGNGGGRHDFRGGHFQNSYQQSPYKQQNQSFSHTPVHHNMRGQRHGFSNTPMNRNNRGHFNSNGRGGGHGGKGPLSDVPIDKFVSINMIKDPWSELDDTKDTTDNSMTVSSNTSSSNTNRESISVGGLDDSEIIIETDTSAFIDNSYNNHDVDSGTEGDSSPVHDTGSDSPYNIATSSTSEKDTGSDSEPYIDTYGSFQ